MNSHIDVAHKAQLCKGVRCSINLKTPQKQMKNISLLICALAIMLIGISLGAIGIYSITHTPTIKVVVAPTEYHMNVDTVGYNIFDESMEPIGSIKYGENPTLDSLMDYDNL